MASAALLFSFSAVVFLFVLLQAPPGPGLAIADLLVSGLDRFLDGRSLMELATRRNMIVLCHAILLLILRDAGVLGAPARRRSRSLGEETAAAVVAAAETEIACSAAPVARSHATRSPVVAQAACSLVPVPSRPYATRSAVVWRRRRPRNRTVVAPVHEHDAAGRVIDCQPAVQAVATWAAPVLTTGPLAQLAEEAAAAVTTKQVVLAESPTPRNDDDDLLDRHDRADVVGPLEHPTAIAADNGERDDCDDDRRMVAIADDDKGIGTEGMEMELADDKAFEEFIESQRRQMRQESLQAIATCY